MMCIRISLQRRLQRKTTYLVFLELYKKEDFPDINFLLKITEKGNTQKVQIRAYENPVILPPHTKTCHDSFQKGLLAWAIQG